MKTPFFSQGAGKKTGIILKLFAGAILFLLINIATTKYILTALNLPDTFKPFQWVFRMRELWLEYPAFFGKVLLCWLAANVILIFFFLALAGIGRKTKGIKGLQGTAKLADLNEMKKSGLVNENPMGVYLGKYTGGIWQYFITDESDGHVLGCAPTRSGKGVAWVIPTLLAYPGSVVCLDVKGENYQLTSGYRAQTEQKILCFDPSAKTTKTRFNPLEEIRLNTPFEIGDAQMISEMVMNPDGKGLDDHWKKSGFSFLSGAILFALKKDKKINLTGLAQMLADPEKEFKNLLDEMKKSGDSFIAECAMEMKNRSDREASSVLSSIMANLGLYRDPIVKKNIAESDFKVSDLMNSERPISLYLVINPKDKGRMTPLIRIVLTLIIKLSLKDLEFKDGEPKPAYKHKMLLLLDEFPSLGHLPVFEESLAYFAGYGIKALIIIQSLEQLHGAYTINESITGNCHIKAFFTPDNLKTAEYLSKMAGDTTVLKETKRVQGNRFSFVLNKSFIGKEEVKRPLFTPDECMRLPTAQKTGTEKRQIIKEAGACMIFATGHSLALCEQSLFFKDPVFLQRSKIRFEE